MNNKISDTTEGIVCRIFIKDGFGFIKDETGQGIFFHKCDVIEPDFNALNIGDSVEFFETESTKGLRALNIVRTVAVKKEMDIKEVN